MSILTAGKVVEEFLVQVTEPTEIRDSSGKLLGYFTPADISLQEFYAEARRHFDREEMSRRDDPTRGGCTYADVMAHLESLELACEDTKS